MQNSIYSKSGFINVLKPSGPTSFDIVYRIRKLLKEKKVGHLGTLDPLAAGVLPIAIGKANKLFKELAFKKKRYRAVFTFGKDTDTADSAGEVLKRDGRIPEEGEVLAALEKFRGTISQKPHRYSAVKIGGIKSCDLARCGLEVDLTFKRREVEIYKLELIKRQGADFTFDIVCSAGTYIRSLCCDIAAELGTYAYVSMLIRLSSGDFDIANSVTLEELEEGDMSKYILPITYPLKEYSQVSVPDRYYDTLSNGMSIPLLKHSTMHNVLHSTMQKVLVFCKGEFFGIGHVVNGQLKLDIFLKENTT
jgi:tRNA pseudouridine55 synthase